MSRRSTDPDNLWDRAVCDLSSQEGDVQEAAVFLLPFSHDVFIEQLLCANKLCCLLWVEMRRCKPCFGEAHSPMGRQGLRKS